MRYVKYNIFVSIVIILLILQQSKRKEKQENLSGAIKKVTDWGSKIRDAKNSVINYADGLYDSLISWWLEPFIKFLEPVIETLTPLWELLIAFFKYVQDITDFISGTDNIITRLAERIVIIVKIIQNLIEIDRLIRTMFSDEAYKCEDEVDAGKRKEGCGLGEMIARTKAAAGLSYDLDNEIKDLCRNVSELIERIFIDFDKDFKDLSILPWNLLLDPGNVIDVRGIPVGVDWFSLLNGAINRINDGIKGIFIAADWVDDRIDNLTGTSLLDSLNINTDNPPEINNIYTRHEDRVVSAQKFLINSADDLSKGLRKLLTKLPKCKKRD